MASYEGPATIDLGGSQIEVMCSYVETVDSSGRGSWDGRLWNFSRPSLATGEAVLELPDGRRGRIIIKRLSHSTPIIGTFVGTGAFPAIPTNDPT